MHTMIPAGAHQPFMLSQPPTMWHAHHSQPDAQPSGQSDNGGRIQGRDKEGGDDGIKTNNLKRTYSESSGSSDGSSDEE